MRNLTETREKIKATIEEAGALNDEIVLALDNAKTLTELDDIYRPFKKKRKTRASVAKEKGLEHIDGAWKVLEKSEIGAGGNTPQTIYKVIKKSEDYSLYESGHSLATPAPGE